MTSAIASLDMSMPPSTLCSAATSCGGVLSNPSPGGAISARLIRPPPAALHLLASPSLLSNNRYPYSYRCPLTPPARTPAAHSGGARAHPGLLVVDGDPGIRPPPNYSCV